MIMCFTCSIQVRLPSMDGRVALVPWADMLNHSCDVCWTLHFQIPYPLKIFCASQMCLKAEIESLTSQVETFLDYDKSSQGVVFTTDRSYEPGEQVSIFNFSPDLQVPEANFKISDSKLVS